MKKETAQRQKDKVRKLRENERKKKKRNGRFTQSFLIAYCVYTL
jgi:hypothetical protein